MQRSALDVHLSRLRAISTMRVVAPSPLPSWAAERAGRAADAADAAEGVTKAARAVRDAARSRSRRRGSSGLLAALLTGAASAVAETSLQRSRAARRVAAHYLDADGVEPF